MSMELSVALVEQTYPINVGYTARIVKNFGYDKLLLINPKFSRFEARKFASHAVDVLDNAKECSFEDLVNKETYLIATTAVSAGRQANLTRQTVPPWEIASIATGRSICLVFGRDTTGLTNEEISRCDLLVKIPASRKYPTLNISHAVAIILYEISEMSIKNREVATRVSMDRIATGFAELALIAGIQERKVHLIEEAFQRILRRSRPTEREASLLVGLPRKIRLALENPKIIRVEKLKASPKAVHHE